MAHGYTRFIRAAPYCHLQFTSVTSTYKQIPLNQSRDKLRTVNEEFRQFTLNTVQTGQLTERGLRRSPDCFFYHVCRAKYNFAFQILGF